MGRKKRRGPSVKSKEPKIVIDTSRLRGIAISMVIALVLLVAVIPFCYGKYIEFNTPGPFDSASYVYSAQHISEGARLRVDEKASARPATLLLNFIGVKIFGFSETGPKIIQTLLQVLALTMMFIALRKLYGPTAACLSVILAAIYLSAPLIAKFGNVKEQFMVAFMVISASCFVLSQLTGRWWWTFATGAVAVNVYFFKETGLSVIIAIVIFLLVKIVLDRKLWRTILKEIALLLAGACIGMIPLYTFYIWQGQAGTLNRSLPVIAIVVLVQLIALGFAVYYVIRFAMNKNVFAPLKKIKPVRKPIWVTGVALIAVTLLSCMYYFHSRAISGVNLQGKQTSQQLEQIQTQNPVDYYRSLAKSDLDLERGGELKSYLNEVAFIKYPIKLVKYPLRLLQPLKRKVRHLFGKATGTEGYVGESRKHLSMKKQSEKVFRFYKALILPIAIAMASLIAGLTVLLLRICRIKKQTTIADRLVILLAAWWLFDMLFVWISPRSYEQYYLPLTASAAMLGGYICSLYSARISAATNKAPWVGAGAFLIVAMTIMVWPIFVGQSHSPHTGVEYKNKKYGFAQSLKRVKDSKKGRIGSWERAGEYIKERTNKNDKIYVWGWYPGIYVKAQRFSSAKKAFEGDMHVKHPETLKNQISGIVSTFKKDPPKYIVDSRKKHFPWYCPLLELWPSNSSGFLPNEKKSIDWYDKRHKKALTKEIGPDEAARYEAMAPFRKFVMDNYTPAEPGQYGEGGGQYLHRMFGIHRVYKLKKSKTPK
jgi:4-amino-4-deoxy-L-arabinose transferase-like glycosyltransferase